MIPLNQTFLAVDSSDSLIPQNKITPEAYEDLRQWKKQRKQSVVKIVSALIFFEEFESYNALVDYCPFTFQIESLPYRRMDQVFRAQVGWACEH